MIETLAEPLERSCAPIRRLLNSFDNPDPTSTGGHFGQDDPVASRVLAALMHKSVSRKARERRNERRYPYPHPVYLTPLAGDVPLVEETVQVFGKHLSEHGFDFYHREPLPYRRMIASLLVDGAWVGLVLDLMWCRFTGAGTYDNGGRFIATAPSPLAP